MKERCCNFWNSWIYWKWNFAFPRNKIPSEMLQDQSHTHLILQPKHHSGRHWNYTRDFLGTPSVPKSDETVNLKRSKTSNKSFLQVTLIADVIIQLSDIIRNCFLALNNTSYVTSALIVIIYQRASFNFMVRSWDTKWAQRSVGNASNIINPKTLEELKTELIVPPHGSPLWWVTILEIHYLTVTWIYMLTHIYLHSIKSALYGLRKFMATESTLKMMKNVFYFTLKALFVLKIFKFLSWLFGHV